MNLEMKDEFFICYCIETENYRCTIRASFSSLNENTCVGIFSHEAIEYLLAKLQLDYEQILDIHFLIGGKAEWYDKILSEADWRENTDGLPNLFR